LSWTLSAAVAIFAAPVSGTIAGGGITIDSRIAAQITTSASSAFVRKTPGSVEVHTRKLELDELALSDFGDEPGAPAR
jgi:hypothetical protein